MPRVDLPPTSQMRREPINIIEFVSVENNNFLTSLINCKQEFDLFCEIDARYRLIMKDVTIPASMPVPLQMFGLAHYHLLFAFSAMMRCHLSEAWNSARIAIDAGLIAEHMTRKPEDQEKYAKSENSPQLIRIYKGLKKQGKTLPHQAIDNLLEVYDSCSSHASHADVNVFVHRITFPENGNNLLGISPFQAPDDPNTMRKYMLELILVFSSVLSLFDKFTRIIKPDLPEDWEASMNRVVAVVNNRKAAIESIPPQFP